MGAIGASSGARRRKQARKRWEAGAPPPSPFIAREGQPASPMIAGNVGFPCMSQGLVKSCSRRGSVGKWRRPRPINRHASTEAAGFWGPRCSELDPWLHREAKPERALGPGATGGVLGTGVPRLACLRPTEWLHHRPCTAHRHQQTFSRPSRGANLAKRMTQDLLGGGLTRPAREGRRDQGKGHLARFP